MKKHEAFLEFFEELAEILLQAEINATESQSLILKGYLQAAAKHAKFRNKKINQSAVAAITGLTRPQVRALLSEAGRVEQRHAGAVENLLNAWMTEPIYTASDGSPRPLPRHGNRASFGALAKRCGGDIPSRALLAELTRRRLVKIRGGMISLNSSHQKDGSKKRQMERLLSTLAMTVRPPSEAEGSRQVRANYAEVTFPSLSATSQVLLRRRVRQSMSAISTDLESAVAALTQEGSIRAVPSKAKVRSPMSKMSILILVQD